MRSAPIVAPRDTVSAAIQAAALQGRPALVGFLTAGFPTRHGFRDNLTAVASVCDVVEIGVPFSDPMADGTTIQRASFVALTGGVTLPWIFEELASLIIREDGTVLWNELEVAKPDDRDMQELQDRLKKAIQLFTDEQPVIIQPRPMTVHSRVVDVVNACAAANVKSLSFAG